jgi:hypothetical protein
MPRYAALFMSWTQFWHSGPAQATVFCAYWVRTMEDCHTLSLPAPSTPARSRYEAPSLPSAGVHSVSPNRHALHTGQHPQRYCYANSGNHPYAASLRTAVSTVRGDFEGADFDKPVALDNGMIFEFTTYSYTYSYRPTAVVLALVITPEDLRKRGISKVPDQPITHYKLLVEDELYDVRRVR